MKKILPLATIAVLGVAAVSTRIWDPASIHYWRSLGQRGLLRAAQATPANDHTRPIITYAVRLALGIHPDGVSDVSMEAAAGLMEVASENQHAAKLWLGLANRRFAAGDQAAAVTHTQRAFTKEPSLRAIESMVMLTRHDPGARQEWLGQLRNIQPRHEIALAYECRNRLSSFAVELPRSCSESEVRWVQEGAKFGRLEHKRIDSELEDLPGSKG